MLGEPIHDKMVACITPVSVTTPSLSVQQIMVLKERLSDMEEIKIFNNPEFGEIRTSGTVDEPLFCLSDVCKALDLGNPSQVKSRLSDGVITNEGIIDSLGREQMVNFVNEDGLYDIILDSRKPEAKRFRKWITSEVLPEIRKHGGYMMLMDNETDEDLMSRALLVAQATLKRREERIKALEDDNKAMKPKADYFDDLVERNLLSNFTDVAKQLNIKRKTFIEYLIRDNFIYRDKMNRIRPYKQYANSYFHINDTKSSNNKWAGVQVLITAEGKEAFRLLYKRYGENLIKFQE